MVKLDAAKPEDMHCDANSPEWVRFLGYAGVPLLLAIPAFFVSVATAFRLFQTHRTIRAAYFDSSRARSAQISGVVAAPAKTPHYRLARAVSPHPVNPTASLSLYSPSLAGHGSPMARGNMPLPASPLGGIRTLPPLSPTMQAGRALSILSVSDYHDDASVYDNVRPPSSPPNVYSTYQLPYGRRPVPQLTQSERDAFSEAGYDMKAREKIPESPEDDSEKESLEVQIPVHASQVHPCFTTGDAPRKCNFSFTELAYLLKNGISVLQCRFLTTSELNAGYLASGALPNVYSNLTADYTCSYCVSAPSLASRRLLLCPLLLTWPPNVKLRWNWGHNTLRCCWLHGVLSLYLVHRLLIVIH